MPVFLLAAASRLRGDLPSARDVRYRPRESRQRHSGRAPPRECRSDPTLCIRPAVRAARRPPRSSSTSAIYPPQGRIRAEARFALSGRSAAPITRSFQISLGSGWKNADRPPASTRHSWHDPTDTRASLRRSAPSPPPFSPASKALRLDKAVKKRSKRRSTPTSGLVGYHPVVRCGATAVPSGMTSPPYFVPPMILRPIWFAAS